MPVIMEGNEPVAIVFHNKNRDRVIYTVSKAGEDEIINLFESNETS